MEVRFPSSGQALSAKRLGENNQCGLQTHNPACACCDVDTAVSYKHTCDHGGRCSAAEQETIGAAEASECRAEKTARAAVVRVKRVATCRTQQ